LLHVASLYGAARIGDTDPHSCGTFAEATEPKPRDDLDSLGLA
jgi:hypothetical protein